MHNRPKSQHLVEIDLDPVPGWGHHAGDHQARLTNYLDDALGHYDPQVTPLFEALMDCAASLVSEVDEQGNGANPEYDRALVEMLMRMCHISDAVDAAADEADVIRLTADDYRKAILDQMRVQARFATKH